MSYDRKQRKETEIMVMYARRIDTSNLKQYDDELARQRRAQQAMKMDATVQNAHTQTRSQREAHMLTGESGEGRPLEDGNDAAAGHLSASPASRRIIAGLADQVGVCHH
jgi:hypothetical protein